MSAPNFAYDEAELDCSSYRFPPTLHADAAAYEVENSSELHVVLQDRTYDVNDRDIPLFGSFYGQGSGSYQSTTAEEAVWTSGSEGIVDSPSSIPCLSRHVRPRLHSHCGLAHTLVGPGYLRTPSLRRASPKLRLRRRGGQLPPPPI